MPRFKVFRFTASLVVLICFLSAYILIPQGSLKRLKIVVRIWPPSSTIVMDDDETFNKKDVKKLPEALPTISKATTKPVLPMTETVDIIQELFSREEKVQAQRRQLIVDSCASKGKKTLNYSNMHYFVYNDKHKIIYCYVPKVACTEWKKVMMILDGHDEKNLSKIAHGKAHEGYTYKRLVNLNKDEAKKRLDTYYKFMFVREPFERLLSAYRDKLARYNSYFASRYGKDILKRYRKNPDPEVLKKGSSVTFKEFIQYIIDGQFDEHWVRHVDLCMPCNINFDFIGHYETLKDDSTYVLHKTKINHLMTFPEIRQSKTSSHLLEYYSTIPKTNLKELGKIYDRDFVFYNYSYPGPLKSLLQEEPTKK